MSRWLFERRAKPTVSIEERLRAALNPGGRTVPFGAGGWTAPDPRPLRALRGGVDALIEPAELDTMVGVEPGRTHFELVLRFDAGAWALVDPDDPVGLVEAIGRELEVLHVAPSTDGCFVVRPRPGTAPTAVRLAGVRALYALARSLQPAA